MKKTVFYLGLLVLATMVVSCSSDNSKNVYVNKHGAALHAPGRPGGPGKPGKPGPGPHRP